MADSCRDINKDYVTTKLGIDASCFKIEILLPLNQHCFGMLFVAKKLQWLAKYKTYIHDKLFIIIVCFREIVCIRKVQYNSVIVIMKMF